MGNWISRLIGKRAAKPAQPRDIGAELLAEWEALSGASERPATAPAWSLALRSPFRPWEGARSWFGGLPALPPGRDWPCGLDGLPMHFVVQIALADLPPEPETGALPPEPLRHGALLLFLAGGEAGARGRGGYAVMHLSEAEMAQAVERPAPEDLPDLRDAGYWIAGGLFNRIPVDPHPFLDSDAVPNCDPSPDNIPPETWITTWAQAAQEADLLIRQIEQALPRYQDAGYWAEHCARLQTAPGSWTSAAEDCAHGLALVGPVAALLPRLIEWRDAAQAQGDTPIDSEALAALLAARRALVPRAKGHLIFWQQMAGLSLGRFLGEMRKELDLPYATALTAEQIARVPQALRPLFEAELTGLRGHRLFGLLTEIGEGRGADRRGTDLLISISADALIGTRREHDFGQSIWVPRADLAAGRLDRGQHLVLYSG